MNILVTGGTGFIGRFFIPELLKEEHNVFLLVRNLKKAKEMFGDSVKYINGDITDKESLKDCCKDIDIVFHMVAKVGNQLPSEKVYEEFAKVNIIGTQNIVEEAKKSNIKKFVYVSSVAAMGIVDESIITENSKCNPFLPYQKTKYEAEKFLLNEYENNKFPVIILRPTKVYGIGEPEFSYLTQVKLCNKGINFIIGIRENYISNICILDFVSALVKCIDNGKNGEVYIISGKGSISAKEFTEIISETLNKKVINVRVPKSIMIICAFFEERLFLLLRKKPLVTVRNIQAVSKDRIYDLSKSERDLCYIPQIDMKEGLRMMVNWYIKEKLI